MAGTATTADRVAKVEHLSRDDRAATSAGARVAPALLQTAIAYAGDVGQV